MLFWLTAFNIGLNEMTIAGAFGAFYWTRFSNIDKKYQNKLPMFTVFGSFLRAIFYHFGTLAFGSLLIAIVKMIRVALEYIDRKLKSTAGQENKIAKYIMCCCKCCFWCLERFLKFLNRYAFVLTAIYSYNFCRAASKAFRLIGANVLRVIIVDNISHFVLLLSNLAITGIVGVASYFFFTGKVPIDSFTSYKVPEFNYYFVPMGAVVLGTFFIGKLFFDVFSMGIDSLLMCVLIDLEENDGSEARPYFMSKRLRKILKK
jgi:choline transporter-like protein 2/4/5